MKSGQRIAGLAGMVELALTHRLTVVVAAAGWGKSTLLRNLAESTATIKIATRPSAWTPFSLARSLVESLRAFAPDAEFEALPAYEIPDAPDNPEQAAALAGAVCTLAGGALSEHTLVLWDDADIPAGDPLEAFLEALVLNVPPLLHVVIACRTAPAIRVARLRASGEVARVAAADLALSTDDLGDLGLSDAAASIVGEIIAATGGWPVAVHLAAEALRREGPVDRESLIDQLLTPDATLFDYLAEDVFAGLPAADREVLTIAAGVPEITPAMLRDLGRADLAGGLARLAADGIFLEPVTEPDRYRASRIGAAFIRRSQPPAPAELLRKAADWYLAHNEIEDAIVTAAVLGDSDVAERVALAVDRPDRLRSTEAFDTTLTLAATTSINPRIRELIGDLHQLRGDWDAALAAWSEATAADWDGGRQVPARIYRKRAMTLYVRGRFDEAEAVCGAAPLDGTDPSEEAQTLSWWATIHWIRGDVDECDALVRRADALANQSGDDAARAAVTVVAAMLASLRGDRGINRVLYRDALAHAQRADDVVQIVRTRSNLGSRLTVEGAYDEALEELEAAIRIAELSGSDTFTGLAYSNRAETYVRVGRLDDALADLQRATAIFTRLRSGGLHYALNNLATVRLLRGQRAEAVAQFEETLTLANAQRDRQSMTNALVGLARCAEFDDPDASLSFARRAIDIGHPDSLSSALLAAGNAERGRGDLIAAAGWVAKALDAAQVRRDRAATGEALLLQASLTNSTAGSAAEQALDLFRELGDPIGESRAMLLIAERSGGARRDALVEQGRRKLQEAGAWRYLARDMARAEADRPTSSITVATLGGFRVSRDGVTIGAGEWRSRKARDVVKLLVARRGSPVVREEIAEALWPDDPDRSARKLSVVVSMIRTVLDPDKQFAPDHYVGSDHDTVWLVRDHVDIDVERFLELSSAGRRHLAEDETRAHALLSEAAALYLGEFCADDPYADWAAGMRDLSKHTFVETAYQLAELAHRDGRFGEAIRHRLRILDVDPYDEESHLGIVKALLSRRRHGEARRAYRTYRSRLAQLDLEAAPFPSIDPEPRGAAQLNTA